MTASKMLLWLGWLNVYAGVFGGLLAIWIKLDGDTRPIELQALGLLYLIAGHLWHPRSRSER